MARRSKVTPRGAAGVQSAHGCSSRLEWVGQGWDQPSPARPRTTRIMAEHHVGWWTVERVAHRRHASRAAGLPLRGVSRHGPHRGRAL